MGKSTINGHFSIAMLVHQRVMIFNGIELGNHGLLMGLDGDFMGLNGDLIGFNGMCLRLNGW